MSQTVQIEIKANLQWAAIPGKKHGIWIGVCEALGLSIEADSLDELHSIIPESMHTLMIDLLQDNEFESYLREKGWTADGFERGQTQDGVNIHVPWQLTVPEGHNDTKRRAY